MNGTLWPLLCVQLMLNVLSDLHHHALAQQWLSEVCWR